METDFTNVKVGDILVLSRWNMPEELVKVTKVTSARFEAGFLTWNKKNGSVIGFGGSFCRPTIYVPKEEDVARIQQDSFVRKVYRKLSALKLEDLTYEKATLIDKIL
jgi:hypothetical protein